MRKKRLIFTLLYDGEYFVLSRNFRLQKVGDLEWIEKYYNFKEIAFSIDELILLNVSRNRREIIEFCEIVKKIVKNIFVPISVGGGISNIDDVALLFFSGADKVVLNTSLKD